MQSFDAFVAFCEALPTKKALMKRRMTTTRDICWWETGTKDSVRACLNATVQKVKAYFQNSKKTDAIGHLNLTLPIIPLCTAALLKTLQIPFNCNEAGT